MGISRRLLNEDEHVLVSTRAHVTALLRPAVLLIALSAAAGFVSTLPGGAARPVLVAAIGAVALAAALRWVVAPFLRWLTTTYTVTDRRLVTRTGVLTRRGHDLPLGRVADVSYERGLWDRLLGRGTLVVAEAGEDAVVELADIPQVEQVYLTISDQVFRDAGAAEMEMHGSDGRG